MKLQVIPRHQGHISAWSGGLTNELYIYPATSSYQDRNFDIRISSATVEESPSTFTSLPDYDRYIASLTGPLELIMPDKNFRVELAPFAVHAFDGAENIISHGTVSDMNLMVKKGLTSHMQFLQKSCTLQPAAHRFLYVPKLDDLNITHHGAETSITLEWTPLEEDTLYVIEETDKPLKLRITNPRAGLLYMIVK